jgi:succinate dehydrogenase/fumarate reductase cytochrome b subunit
MWCVGLYVVSEGRKVSILKILPLHTFYYQNHDLFLLEDGDRESFFDRYITTMSIIYKLILVSFHFCFFSHYFLGVSILLTLAPDEVEASRRWTRNRLAHSIKKEACSTRTWAYLICRVHSSEWGLWTAWNRWSLVYVSLPTVNKWMSRCLTHEICKEKTQRESLFWIGQFVMTIVEYNIVGGREMEG